MAKLLLSAFADEAASDIDSQITALKKNGIKFIEIRNVDGRFIAYHNPAYIKEIKNKLESKNIKISSIGSPIGKIFIDEPFAPHIEAFKKALEAANILGTQRIRIFSFFIPKNKKAENCRNEVLERLDSLIALSENVGVACCHENEKEIYGDIKDRCIDLLSSFGGRLKGIFDPANFIQCGETPIAIFDKLFKYIDYMHIKDAFLSDGAVVPAGKGDSDISGLLSKFVKAEGDRFLTIEPHLTVFEGFSDLRDNSLKHRYTYTSSNEAFDDAVDSLKDILNERGYTYE